ncbi:MAG: NUDIX hydrolase, partial [Candidatus Izemoplasmataceae bacterium]
LDFIENNDDVLYRSNLVAHMTSSAIVTDASVSRVLFAYHNIYDSWSWVGGHNDGNPDLLDVAIKEAKEETGVENIHPRDNELLALDIVHVTNHYKNGAFVPDHLHLNATYHLIADENAPLVVKEDENSAVRWFEIDDVLKHVDEPRMVPIYKKIFDSIK